jgi:hypothetical protein
MNNILRSLVAGKQIKITGEAVASPIEKGD